jgi:hypothetical protein
MKENKIYKVIAPVKGRDEKTWWMQIGIAGFKDGKVWQRLNSIPTGNWDGYCMIVEDVKDAPGNKGGKNAAKARKEDGPGPDGDGAEEVPF